MKRLLLALVVALGVCAPELSAAQSLPILTRSTAIAGLNDSALTLVSDSAQRTRASTTHELFKRPAGTAGKPSFSFALDSTSGLYRFGKDTLGFSIAGANAFKMPSVGKLLGPAGDMTITAGTGASRTLTLQSTNSGTAALPFLTGQADQNVRFFQGVHVGSGLVTVPTYTFTSDTTTGLFQPSGGSIAIASGGIQSLLVSATAATFHSAVQVRIGQAGSSTAPAIAWNGFGLGTGFFLAGSQDTIGVATRDTLTLSVTGGRNAKMIGGAGNMTIQGGTGASRTLTLATTTSGSTVKNVLTLGADSSAAFLGLGNFVGSLAVTSATNSKLASTNTGASGKTWYLNSFSDGKFYLGENGAGDLFTIVNDQSINGIFLATNRIATGNGQAQTAGVSTKGVNIGFDHNLEQGWIQVTRNDTSEKRVLQLNPLGGTVYVDAAAEGSTQSALCITSAGIIQKNAAATCTVSSRRFKTNIQSLSCADAQHMVSGLRPVTYEEKVGGSKRLGIIAEEADSVDPRLASRDAKGLITSTNYEEVFTALLRVQQCKGK